MSVPSWQWLGMVYCAVGVPVVLLPLGMWILLQAFHIPKIFWGDNSLLQLLPKILVVAGVESGLPILGTLYFYTKPGFWAVVALDLLIVCPLIYLVLVVVSGGKINLPPIK